ncbi:hypothetical protein [Arthrobacter sp. JCM 19049]|uniref:hypothetical protein n=1 Tax=Arthrobacter sp. JCM 19049 TaxID=1460643 RepID=UPI0024364518|nr:hypothetical protein [Arthrobacter sp. JCM 19049]
MSETTKNPTAPATPARSSEAAMSPTRRAVRQFFSNKLAVLGTAILVALVLFSFLGHCCTPPNRSPRT